MICPWCKRDNGKRGQSLDARFCTHCGKYGADKSVVDANLWCEHCGYTGNSIVCPTCAAPLVDPEFIADIDEALELEKRAAAHEPPLEDDDIPF
jgi:tRNA G26 N,N-dimethylase Trm1